MKIRILLKYKAYIDNEQVKDTPPHPYPIHRFFLLSRLVRTKQKKN